MLELLPLVEAMQTVSTRALAARRLAERLGARDLIVLLHDAAVDAWLPALGFPATLAEGVKWQRFVRDVVRGAETEEELALPGYPPLPVVGHQISAASAGG